MRFLTILFAISLSLESALAQDSQEQSPSFDNLMTEFSSLMEEGYRAGLLLPVNVPKGIFLKVTTPPGFTLASSQNQTMGPEQRMIMSEFIPQGESIDNWMRIITTQSFIGLGNKAGPLMENILQGIKDAVGEINVDDPEFYLVTQIDYTESSMKVTYSNRGMKEMLIVKIFSGPYDTAVAQMTYRYKSAVFNDADKFEKEFLENVALVSSAELSNEEKLLLE
jgi:hypothetical protein